MIRLHFLLLTLLFAFTGCDNSSEKLVPDLPKDVILNKTKENIAVSVDILFVIDDSGSMSTHQRNLSKNISLFVDEIRKIEFLDYRIGVTTSSAYTGESYKEGINGNLIGQPKYIDRKTIDGDNILKSRLMVGVDGSSTEQFFQPSVLAFSPFAMKSMNSGFVRKDAFLAVIFITDAEDQSQISSQEAFDFLTQFKRGVRRRVVSYGAIIPSNSTTNCSRDEWNVKPQRIEDFIRLTQGLYFDLCDPNFGDQLAAIGENLARKATGEVYLSRRPNEKTIVVTYGTQVIPNDPLKGWVYSPRRNSLAFGPEVELSVQPQGTELAVYFEPLDPDK